MAAGYDLKEAKYDQKAMMPTEIKNIFLPFFEKISKKEATYKYAMFQSILDTMDTSTDVTFKISFDTLFTRFSEIYWVLVVKHKLPQKAYSTHAPQTLAEKIIDEVIEKYKIPRNKGFRELPESIQVEIVLQMKKQCSKYVFGALYAETKGIFYSFSKDKEWIKMNPLVVNYIKKHKAAVQIQNYQAWGKFYAEVVLPGKGDAGYYQKLLKREFNDNTILKISLKKKTKSKTKCNVDKTTKQIDVQKDFAYDPMIAAKARKVLEKYPDLGLYLAQIAEQVQADKEQLLDILENSYWCNKEGSRYYYVDITATEIIAEATFKEEDLWAGEVVTDLDAYSEIDMDKIKLLDDPELLIKQLKKEKQLSSANIVSDTRDNEVQKSNNFENKNQKRWDREEVVILVTEYFKTKGLSEESIVKSQYKISSFLRRREEVLTGTPVDEIFRNFAGIRMQSSRIRCLDPDTKYHGMQGTKLQKEVVQEYLKNPKALIREAKQIYKKYN